MTKVKRFDFSEAEPDRVWLIIGARNTGKTVLLRDILYKMRRHIDFAVAMTTTVSTAEMLKKVLPPKLVHSDGYDPECAEKFLQCSKTLVRKGTKRKMALILDDCMFDTTVMKSKCQRELHLNGRHYHTSVFNTTQYVMAIPPLIRSNIDYVIALKEPVKANRRKLYEYFYGVFPSFEEFESTFAACTDNYGCMVLDRTKGDTSLRSMIRFYRASAKLPPFTIGGGGGRREKRKRRRRPTADENQQNKEGPFIERADK